MQNLRQIIRLLDASDLSISQKTVLLSLAFLAREKEARTHIEELALLAGYSARSVQLAIKVLASKGLIEIEQIGTGRGNQNIYRLLDLSEEREYAGIE